MTKNIGIFGMGVVGSAVYNGLIYNGSINKNNVYRYDINHKYDRIEDVVFHSSIIFVCVPTPTIKIDKDKFKQDLSYVDNAIESINLISKTKKTIVIKSTILPGTTRSYSIKYPLHNFIFNPEFLTARKANEDFINQVQIILGGNELNDIEKLYKKILPNTPIRKVSWETAELLKYTCNVFYSIKVAYANQIYNSSKKLNIPYDNVKELFINNGWTNSMHLDVPGPDKKLGFGGACLPKDLQAFISWGENQGMNMNMFLEVNSFNDEVRGE
jgi:nucleotide sugar dehydrogenase